MIMETMKKIQWTPEDSWIATLVSLLPLWLLSLVILAIALPQPPIPEGWAVSAVLVVMVVGLALLWKGWLEIDLFLYSLFPFLLFFFFGEVYIAYRFPFIVLCVLLLSAGMVMAQYAGKVQDSLTTRWLILFLVAVATWIIASHAAQNYWHMLADLGYGAPPLECMPNTTDCPLIGNAAPWWTFFFSP
jgi:hypothetical protein